MVLRIAFVGGHKLDDDVLLYLDIFVGGVLSHPMCMYLSSE